MVPFSLVPLIEESVAKFELQVRADLKFFATDALVAEKTAQYRAEVTELATRAYVLGEEDYILELAKELAKEAGRI